MSGRYVIPLWVVGLFVGLPAATGVAGPETFDTRRFGGRGLQDIVLLALNESVQNELEMTSRQKEQVAEMLIEFNKHLAPLMPKLQSSSPEEATPEQWEEYNQKMVAAYNSAYDHVRPRLQEQLTASQLKRLQEILVQCRGPAGIGDESVSEQLMLTDVQKTTLRRIQEHQIELQQELFAQLNSRLIDDLQNASLQLQKERDLEILNLLTAEQRERFDLLKGKPFDLGTIRNAPFANGVFGPKKKTAAKPSS